MPADSDQTSLGNVLLRLGVLTVDRLMAAAREQNGDTPLGAILLALRMVSQTDLDCALRVQEALRHDDRLGAGLLIVEYQTNRVDRSLDRQLAQADEILAKLQ